MGNTVLTFVSTAKMASGAVSNRAEDIAIAGDRAARESIDSSSLGLTLATGFVILPKRLDSRFRWVLPAFSNRGDSLRTNHE